MHDTTVQAEATQAPTPLIGAHARPQPPQSVVLLRVFTSQPFEGNPSQSAKPGRQLPTAHVPPRQAATALGSAHIAPQAPHAITLVRRFVSQPLTALPSQLAKPAEQAKPHVLAAQVGVAFAGAEHGAPQLPQFATEVLKSTSQPSSVDPLQLPAPAMHAPSEQTPALQVPTARGNAQLRPHAPQWASDTARSVSQPLLAVRSQLSKPASHRPMEQLPPEQSPVARGKVHLVPHIRQFALSFCRSTSQPLTVLPSQSPRSVAHAVRVHSPPMQSPTPPKKLHSLPQRPQFVSVRARSTSQPLAVLPSQSPKPGAHA